MRHARDAFVTADQLIVPLSRASSLSSDQVGGKALNLARMLQAGLPVPDGFVITTRAFDLWRRGQSGETTRSGEVMPPIARTEIEVPAAVREALQAALLSWRSDPLWAVRSSATAEDLGRASFAGQYESTLNVRGLPALLEAVRACWRSAFNQRAAAYRRQRLPVGDTSMAVLVQEMVHADAAGVIFTADPITQKRDRMILEAVPGLGDVLVSGKVSPDRITLEKDSLRILDWQKANGSDSGIHPELAAQIGEAARAIERLFAAPQDIEWAVRDGAVFVVQARPITTLADGDEPPPEIWTNANIMEALPDVVTPMAWSLMEILLNEFLAPFMKRLGIETEHRSFITLICGRAYLNVGMVNDLVHTGAGFIHVDVTTAFGGLHAPAEAALKSTGQARKRSLLQGWRAAGWGLWLLPGLFGRQRVLERWGDVVFGELARTPPQQLTDEQLAQQPLRLIRVAVKGSGQRTLAAAAWMAAAGVGGSTLLFRLTRKWLRDVDGSMASRLLAGASQMHSAENGLALLRLAAWARQFPRLKEHLLNASSFDQAATSLSRVEGGLEFLQRWEEFLREHGHQARGGMDIGQPRWREMPDFVLDMLRTYLRYDTESDPLTSRARQQRERRDLLLQVRRQLRNPCQRWFLSWLVGVSQTGLMQRENVKNAGVRLVSIMREAVLEAGRRLVKRGVLKDANDALFLRLDELRPALLEQDGSQIAGLVGARKAEHARLTLLSPPPVVVGSYDPGPMRSKAASAQDNILRGLAVSPGVAEGKARVILQSDAAERVEPGEILVAPYTDPGWTPYFLAAAGVVVDIGGMLSHGSVVAREYGLPAVVNVGVATHRIKTGQRLRVDGRAGTVTLLPD